MMINSTQVGNLLVVYPIYYTKDAVLVGEETTEEQDINQGIEE